MIDWLFLHKLDPDIKYCHEKTLQNKVPWSFLGQILVTLWIFYEENTKNDVNNDVKIEN